MGRWDNKVKHFDLDNFVIKSVKGEGDGAVINAEDGRKVYLNLSADCCSTSYFDKESIEALEGMVGHTLRRLEEVETDAPEKGCTQEDQKVHALLVTTDKASDTMLWRNDSNGYYDGYLDIEIA